MWQRAFCGRFYRALFNFLWPAFKSFRASFYCDAQRNFKGNRHLIWYNLEHKPFPSFSHDSGSICHFSFSKPITRGRFKFRSTRAFLLYLDAKSKDFLNRYDHLKTEGQSQSRQMRWKTFLIETSRPLLWANKGSEHTKGSVKIVTELRLPVYIP